MNVPFVSFEVMHGQLREKMLERQAKYQQQLDYEIANKKAQKDKKAAKAAEKKKADRAKKISDSF